MCELVDGPLTGGMRQYREHGPDQALRLVQPQTLESRDQSGRGDMGVAGKDFVTTIAGQHHLQAARRRHLGQDEVRQYGGIEKRLVVVLEMLHDPIGRNRP